VSQTLVEWANSTRLTLAIVFTDIVASTVMRERLGDEAMYQIIDAHLAKSRELIMQHEGYAIKWLGDGDMAVFRTVDKALDYVLTLRANPGHYNLQLRGAIHIGSVRIRGDDNDIDGRHVNIAARIVGANTGAEIWLSDEAMQDVNSLRAERHRSLRWCQHDSVALKDLGGFRVWSLIDTGIRNSFSAENLGYTMSNPRYSDDLERLDRGYDRKSVINSETIIVVVGKSVPAELLDRPAADLLRDEIDRRGGSEHRFRRAIVLTDEAWDAETTDIAMNAVISIGGPRTNKLTKDFDEWQAPEGSHEGKFHLEGSGRTHTGFFRLNPKGSPQVGLWGNDGRATWEVVERYVKSARGLDEFLKIVWK
jgi:class 3 adenylate cyclase